ncbi:MAG: hypothetical protein EPN39_01190 [Chitinophagaceae bacterium]|nr:MAG: hypothetical protein EPN39_01190 [Chitinophagaceae bacterium]
MYLHNLHVVDVNGSNEVRTIRIVENRINAIGTGDSLPFYEKEELSLSFEHAIVFPGLINSHDHLDFNLFPALGHKTYSNYIEWGATIHREYGGEIKAILRVPKPLRTQWGIYKNLLNGVTTVLNHGNKLSVGITPIAVNQSEYSLHSMRLEKNMIFKINNPFNIKRKIVIHIGEGIDKDTFDEINRLIHLNVLRKALVGVHGIAMNEDQAAFFKALVWCPDSNYFLFGQTAKINKLKDKLPVIFGTDSTLTGKWNIWEQIRIARQTNMVTEAELFNMLTMVPADIWQLPFCGKVAEGYQADLVVAKMKNKEALASFFTIDPADILLVLHKGNIRLFDGKLYQALSNRLPDISRFNPVYIDGQAKYILGDLPGLSRIIRDYYTDAFFPFTVE